MSDPGYENYGPQGENDRPAEQPETPEASPPAGQAAPGPHPHEAADIRQTAGNVARWPDPMEGFRDDDEPQGGVTPQ